MYLVNRLWNKLQNIADTFPCYLGLCWYDIFFAGVLVGRGVAESKPWVGAFLLSSFRAMLHALGACQAFVLREDTPRYSLCKSTFSSGKFLHILRACSFLVVDSCIWISCFCNFCYLRPSFVHFSFTFLGMTNQMNTLNGGTKQQSDNCGVKIVDMARRAEFSTLALSFHGTFFPPRFFSMVWLFLWGRARFLPARRAR